MRVIVTGSRDLFDEGPVVAALEKALAEIPTGDTLVVVHGSARGTDTYAAEWVDARQAAGVPVRQIPYPAQWDAPCGPACRPGHRRARRDGSLFCPAQGNYRNQDMVNDGADACYAFFAPGAANTGTADCAERADTAGIPVIAHGPVPARLRTLGIGDAA